MLAVWDGSDPLSLLLREGVGACLSTDPVSSREGARGLTGRVKSILLWVGQRRITPRRAEWYSEGWLSIPLGIHAHKAKLGVG